MGMISRFLIGTFTSTIRKTIPNARTEKLQRHYDSLSRADRLAGGDAKSQAMISQTLGEISTELARRGVRPDRRK